MINKLNIPMSKNNHLIDKIIICNGKLLFGINIFSYLIGSFHNFLEKILTHNFYFLGIEVGLKFFFICTLEMVVGSLSKDSTYTIKLLFEPL